MNSTNEKERISELLYEENERRVQSSLNSADSDFVPSRSFIRRMNRIIANARAGRDLDYKPSIGKYVALSLVAVMLLTAIVLAACTNAFSYVGERLRSEINTIFGIGNETTAQDTIDTEYLPSYVPLGFTESERSVLPTLIRYAWTNEKGESLVFVQQHASEETIFEEDNLVFSEIKTDGLAVTVAQNDTIVHYVWSAHGYSFKITAFPSLSGNIVLRMIKSISEKK